MDTNVRCEFESWLRSLEFDKEKQTENEIRRLTPPETRDLWRAIMTHVVPINRRTYIKKILLLNEIKRIQGLKGEKHQQTLSKNLKSVEELQKYTTYKQMLEVLNNQERVIRNKHDEIEKLKKKFNKLKKQKYLSEEEKTQHQIFATVIQIKIKQYRKLSEELLKIRECLTYASDSLFKTFDHVSQRLMKRLISRSHNFRTDKYHNILDDCDFISKQEKFYKDFVISTQYINSIHLQTSIILSLKDTLTELKKLGDQKSSTSVNLVSKSEILQLKKQCVCIYADNHSLSKKLEVLKGKVQKKCSDVINENYGDEKNKKYVENWLKSECWKHLMQKRQKFLLEAATKAKNDISDHFLIDFTKVEEKTNIFFECAGNLQNQLICMENKIIGDLGYLSNQLIESSICDKKNYKSKIIKSFIQKEKLLRSHSTDPLCSPVDPLDTEISLLEKLFLLLKNGNSSNLNSTYDSIPNNYIPQYIQRNNFHLVLKNACFRLFQNDSHLIFPDCTETLRNKIIKIQSEEDEFLWSLEKSLDEAKTNLERTEMEAEKCAKNVEFWIERSFNEIIPEHILMNGHTFSQWQENYQRNFNFNQEH